MTMHMVHCCRGNAAHRVEVSCGDVIADLMVHRLARIAEGRRETRSISKPARAALLRYQRRSHRGGEDVIFVQIESAWAFTQ
jgi:hypothetical protein